MTQHTLRQHWIGAVVGTGLGLGALLLGGFRAYSDEPIQTAQFPKGFQWCVATAAHQIEGYNTHSDYWQFESVPGNVHNNDKSGPATDHWNRMEEDIALMKALNLTQYRFSVEWAKIEPREGEIDRTAIQHYVKLIKLLEKAKIRPLVTLHHFTFPQWVRERGGWEWDGVAWAFEKYTKLVYKEIGPNVQDWVTINEPLPHLGGGYLTGVVPPMKKVGLKGLVAPMRGLLKGHAASYHALHDLAKASGKTIRVGVAHHLRTFDVRFILNPLDHIVVGTANAIWNWMVPNAIETGRFQMSGLAQVSIDEEIPGLKGTQDYFGLNYYTGDVLAFSFTDGIARFNRSDLEKNDMGWDIYPEGFYRLMKEAHERYPQHQILITENGIADAKDLKRKQYLKDHLTQVARAIQEKIPVEGYCYWSLLDNFEWNEGYDPRFGLYAMDYSNFKRTLRDSGRYFGEIAARNGIPPELASRAPASVTSAPASEAAPEQK